MRKPILGLTLAAVALCALTPWAMGEQKNDNGREAAVIRNLDIFNSLYKELNTFYVDTLNAKKSIETAIYGMLGQIDPYTEYIPQEDQKDFMVVETGEYGGIGSIIQQLPEGGVIISCPYEGSPAAKAGLRAGDRIVAIDNDSCSTWDSEKVSKRLKGQPNTTLHITAIRPYDTDSVKHFTLTREKIKMDPVQYYGVQRGNIGYIYLNTFNTHSAEQVKQALLELKRNPEVKYIVLDLRDNGGGILDAAIKIVGFFVPKGTQVLQTKGRSIQDCKTYKTSEAPICADMPLAVLINGYSASASEITAGALQDLDRAVVIGNRSFGKGLVQTTRPLPGDGLLKVTISKYYTPSGRLIQAIDYSHRNAYGEAQRIPDSLTTVFHTVHGREVRDGGGITPDIKVENPDLNRLVYNISRYNWDFNFATKWVAEHPTIASPRDFKVTDDMFAEFKKFIDPKKFNYDKVCEQRLDALRKAAADEGYMNDSTKAVLDQLALLLKHDLNHDLDNNRKHIETLLSKEIMKRYYYERGSIENSLLTDEAIDKAEAMFSKQGEYERILGLNGSAATTSKTAKGKDSKKRSR